MRKKSRNPAPAKHGKTIPGTEAFRLHDTFGFPLELTQELASERGLQVDDPKLRAYAQLSLPRLQAAYAQVIQIYAAGLPSGAEPNTEFIVQALQRQTDLILKRPGARFLIGAVLVS